MISPQSPQSLTAVTSVTSVSSKISKSDLDVSTDLAPCPETGQLHENFSPTWRKIDECETWKDTAELRFDTGFMAN
jgi:hypothetical protein